MNYLSDLAKAAQPNPQTEAKPGDANPTQQPNLSGLLGTLAAAGGAASQSGAGEQTKQDYVDKAVDLVQQRLGQGGQVCSLPVLFPGARMVIVG